MFGLGYLIKKGIKTVVYSVTEDDDLAAAMGLGVAFIATGGLSVIDEIVENGADFILDGTVSNIGGTILDQHEVLRQGE